MQSDSKGHEGSRNHAFSQLDKGYQVLVSSWKRALASRKKIQGFAPIEREALELSKRATEIGAADEIKILKEIVRRLRWVLNKRACDASDEQKISSLLESFKQQLETLKPSNVVALHPNSSEGSVNNVQRHVGLLVADGDLAAIIEEILNRSGFKVSTCSDVLSFKKRMQLHDFDIALVDLLMPDCPLSSAMALEEFLSDNPIDIPVVMLSDSTDLSTRLIALRAGIKAYITKPVCEEELVPKLENILAKHSASRVRVMVVDDDPMLTEYYEAALQEDGFIVKAVNDPILLLKELDAFKPDVITLDYMMPGCNGLEVAEILRGDPRYMKIPLVFMSASEEAIQRRGLMDLFGNNFLMKPVDTEQLTQTLTDITAKAKKVAEEIQKVSQRDSEVHLENRDFFFHHLEKKLSECVFESFQQQNEYIALISLDNILEARENHGSLALLKTEEDIESYFAKHSMIRGKGCRFGDHNYLLSITDQAKLNPTLLFKRLQEEFKRQGFLPEITTSIGACKLDGALPLSIEETIVELESACIAASNAGGSTTQWLSTKTQAAAPSQKIYDALKARKFELVYQSIVQPEGDEQIFEVLVRLRDEDGNVYTPSTFLPVLDEAIEEGHYELDRWVIEHAFQALESITGRGKADYSIVIKLCPNLKQAERLLPFIYNTVSNTRLRGVKRIYFSIPEKAVLKDLAMANSFSESLATAKCGFIIEHSLANKKSIEAIDNIDKCDFVKLDPTVNKQHQGFPKAKATIHKLKSAMSEKGHVIAGLVEDANTFANYWDMDIRYFQGFFIHKPHEKMNASSFAAESLVLEK